MCVRRAVFSTNKLNVFSLVIKLLLKPCSNILSRVKRFRSGSKKIGTADWVYIKHGPGRERKEDGKPCVTSAPTMILFEKTFRRTSLSFKQIFL